MLKNSHCLQVDLINGAKNMAEINVAYKLMLAFFSLYIYISKIPHNSTSDSLIAFPTKFSQYSSSSALFCCFSLLQSHIFFERIEQKGVETAQV